MGQVLVHDFQACLLVQVRVARVVNPETAVWYVEAFGRSRVGRRFGFFGGADHLVELLFQLGVIDISEFGRLRSSIFKIDNEPCGGGFFCSDGFFPSSPVDVVGGTPGSKELCASRPALAGGI